MNEKVPLLPQQKIQRTIHSLRWNDFDDLTSLLAQKIQRDATPEVLVGLQRGGLIPAVALSHRFSSSTFLTLPVRRTVSDAIYAEKQDPVVERNDIFTHVTGKDVMVVDDIVGSGMTLKTVLQMLQFYAPARLRSATYVLNQEHWDPRGEKPTYIGKELFGWVVFPWEECSSLASHGEQATV